MNKAGALKSPLTWLAGLIVLYLGYPLAAFAVRLVTSPQRGFHAPGLFPALWVSVCGATISLALVTLLGVPLAYRLARSNGRVASVIGVIVMIPLALPPLMSGIVLVYLVGPYTFLGQLSGERLTDSMIGVVIAMTFVSAPFLIVAARAAFAGVDQGLLDVAKTLGHSDLSNFLQVAVPGAGPGIRAGMLLTWLRAFGEYGAVVILAYNPASLPIYTYNQFSGRGLPTTLAPTAFALAVAVVVVVISRVKLRAPHRRPTIDAVPRTPARGKRPRSLRDRSPPRHVPPLPPARGALGAPGGSWTVGLGKVGAASMSGGTLRTGPRPGGMAKSRSNICLSNNGSSATWPRAFRSFLISRCGVT